MSLIQGLADYSGAAATWRARNGYMLQTPSSVNFAFVKNGNLPSWATHGTYFQECTSGIQGLHDNQYINDPALQAYELFPYVMHPTNLRDVLQNALTNPNPIAGSNQRTASLIDPSGTPFNFSSVSTEPAIVFSRLLGRFVDSKNPLSVQYSQALYSRMDGDHFLTPETKQISAFAKPNAQDRSFFAQQSSQKNLIDYGVVHKEQEIQHVDPADLRSRYPRASRYIDSKFSGGNPPSDPGGGGSGVNTLSGQPTYIFNQYNSASNVHHTTINNNGTGTSNVPNPAFNPNQQTSAQQGETAIGISDRTKNAVATALVVSERLLNPAAFTPDARRFALTLRSHTEQFESSRASYDGSTPFTDNSGSPTYHTPYNYDEAISNINSPLNSERAAFTNVIHSPGATEDISLLHSLERVFGFTSSAHRSVFTNPGSPVEKRREMSELSRTRNRDIQNALDAYLLVQEQHPYDNFEPPTAAAPVPNPIADNITGDQTVDKGVLQAVTNSNQNPFEVNPSLGTVTESATSIFNRTIPLRIKDSYGGSKQVPIGPPVTKKSLTSQNTAILKRARDQDLRSVVNGEKESENVNKRVQKEIIPANASNYQREIPGTTRTYNEVAVYNPDTEHNMTEVATQLALFPMAVYDAVSQRIDFDDRTYNKRKRPSSPTQGSISPPTTGPSTPSRIDQDIADHMRFLGSVVNQSPTLTIGQYNRHQMHASSDTSYPQRVRTNLTHEQLDEALKKIGNELGGFDLGLLREESVEGQEGVLNSADKQLFISKHAQLNAEISKISKRNPNDKRLAKKKRVRQGINTIINSFYGT